MRRLGRGLFAALVATGTVAASAASAYGAHDKAASKPTVGEWTTYGGSFLRQSDQPLGPPLRPLRVRWKSPVLDGGVYGEPLVYDGEVEVATESDTVYALNASTGRVHWRVTLGAPVPASDLPCGDISPTVGVTSTMVIDPARGDLFVSAALVVRGAVHHEVVALALTSGRVLWRVDVDRPGWDAAAQLQRAGLALDAGRVIVGFGGNYGDCSDYHGYVMAVAESGHGTVLSYEVPTGREGAVWAPAGVSVSAAGDIYAVTGNGSSDSARDFDEGDSVIELSPRLRRLGLFAPSDWLQLNDSDGDLGSGPLMLLPGNRGLVVGKDTTGYLVDTQRLGGIGGQLASATLCFSQGGDAYLAPRAFVACPTGTLTAAVVGTRSLKLAWRGPAGTSGSPTIAGGAVWDVSGGHLSGLAPTSGKLVAEAAAVPTEHFAAPSAGEGLLLVGGEDQVEAFEGPRGWTGS